MKVRVISDDTSLGTRVELESGEILGGVKYVQITLSADQEESEVVLGLSSVPIEIVANAHIYEPEQVEDEETWGRIDIEKLK